MPGKIQTGSAIPAEEFVKYSDGKNGTAGLNFLEKAALKLVSKCLLIPESIGIIPDGNRRWSKEKYGSALDPTSLIKEAYSWGTKSLIKTLQYADYLGIEEIVVYGMSLENLNNRAGYQRDFLLSAFTDLLEEVKKQKPDLQIFIAGQLDRLPKKLQDLIQEIESRNDPKHKRLTICIAYSGITEMHQACLKVKHIKDDDEMIKKFNEICTAKIKKVDFIIRTGFHSRISDFACWQAKEAVLYFPRCFWPDFNIVQMLKALYHYDYHA